MPDQGEVSMEAVLCARIKPLACESQDAEQTGVSDMVLTETRPERLKP